MGVLEFSGKELRAGAAPSWNSALRSLPVLPEPWRGVWLPGGATSPCWNQDEKSGMGIIVGLVRGSPRAEWDGLGEKGSLKVLNVQTKGNGTEIPAVLGISAVQMFR